LQVWPPSESTTSPAVVGPEMFFSR
jgi:hypothetical protein